MLTQAASVERSTPQRPQSQRRLAQPPGRKLIRRLERLRRLGKLGLLQSANFAKKWLQPELLALTIEVCRACNLRCTYCAMHGEVADPQRIHLPSTYFLESALLERILKDLDAAGLSIPINLSYSGEVLVHPQFVALMDQLGASGHAPMCGFTTNGMLLNDERSEAIVRNGIAEVCISVDGEAEANDLRRQRSSSSKIMRNVLRLIELRDAMGAARPLVTLKAVTGDCSAEDLETFLAAYLPKVQRISVIPELPLNLHVDLPYRGIAACYFPFFSMTITSDGAVALCCFDVGGMNVREVDLNVREGGVLDVFHGPEMTSLRTAMIERRTQELPQLCRGCNAYDTVGSFVPLRYRVRRSADRTSYTTGMISTHVPGRRRFGSYFVGRLR